MSQKRFEYISKSFWKRVNKNSLTWWYVLKASWRDLCKTSSKRLEGILKISWRRFCKTSWRRLEDVLKTSWRRLEDVWPRRIYWSWPRRLEDVFWRRKAKANIFVLIKTSWRRLEDVFWRRRQKTSSRRLQDVFIKTNVCWDNWDQPNVKTVNPKLNKPF